MPQYFDGQPFFSAKLYAGDELLDRGELLRGAAYERYCNFQQ
jgi:hypothetical protein